MPIEVTGDNNPANDDATPNLIQVVQSLAYGLKAITGKNNWYTPSDASIPQIQEQAFQRIIWKDTSDVSATVFAVDADLISFTIPGNSVQAGDILHWRHCLEMPNTVSTTTYTHAINGVTVWTQSNTSVPTTRTLLLTREFFIRSASTVLTNAIGVPGTFIAGTNNTAVRSLLVDWSQPVNFSIKARIASGNVSLKHIGGYLELIR